MNAPATTKNSMNWLLFATLTVACWGLYGIFLHKGQVAMANKISGRYQAFLFVGVAYLLIAVLGSALMLGSSKAAWTFTRSGITWSTIAGVVGAIGAFGVLLAFGAGGKPAFVMSIIFAGAPIVNAVVALAMHPPAGGWGAVRWQFVLGILLAALGGCLVSFFKPS